jgi:hypothetical protein
MLQAGWSVAAPLIMSGGAPAPALRQAFNAAEPIIKTQVEIDTLHLPVRDEVGACPKLIIDRQTNRVPDGLVPILLPKKFRLVSHVVTELGVPARE